MAKSKRKAQTIADKLTQTKKGQQVLAKQPCPNCCRYHTVVEEIRYRCALLGEESRDYHGISYPITTVVPCTITDALNCPLKGLGPSIPEATKCKYIG